MSAGAPYALAGRALRRAARVLDAEPMAAQHQKLVARLSRRLRGSDLARTGEFLGEMAGIRDEASESVELAAALNAIRSSWRSRSRAPGSFCPG